jgi:iron complex transport system substrate-binding protein
MHEKMMNRMYIMDMYKRGYKASMEVLAFITFLFIAAVPSAWCRGKSESVQSGKSIVTVTDVAGRQVTLELPVKKVSINASGSGGPFMTMSALLGTEVADYLSSWDEMLKLNRFDMYDHYRSKIPALEQVPVVGRRGDYNIEKIISLNPDVVIWTIESREGAKAIAEPAFEAAGIPLVYIDYLSETVENHTKSTQLLGQLFGKKERADEIIKFYVDTINMIEERLVNTSARPLVYVEGAMSGPNMYSNTYGNVMWGATISKAGGTNIAEGIVVNWSPISAELLLSKNPDVIILTGSYWPNYPESVRMGYLSNEAEVQRQIRTYRNRPGWSDLNAIKNDRLFVVHHGLTSEVYDVAALAFFAKCIHPELFADIDPMGMLQEYYDRFLPYDLYGVWMTQLK